MKSGIARLNRALALVLPFLCLLSFALAATAQLQPGTIDTYVGGSNGDGEAAINATINPRGLALAGNPSAPDVYIADSTNNRVRRVDGNTGLITTVAGNGIGGYAGDGNQGQNASLFLPFDVAVDGAGNVYIADTSNSRIRKVGTDGRISTFAGNGNQTYSGEGIATQVAINQPYGVAVGPDGSVYIADTANNRIRKVGPPGCTASTCVISTVAGNGRPGFLGDGGQATQAEVSSPDDVTVDSTGVLYIADTSNNRVRRVALDGTISTVAGGGTSLADGVPGTQAKLSSPGQVALDSSGNVYVTENGGYRIRMLQAASFTISTVAGTGTAGNSGDGGPPTGAQISSAYGVAASTPGTFWLSQSNASQPITHNNRVRMVTNSSVIQAAIGGGLGDGSAATDAFVDPRGGEAATDGCLDD